MARTVRDSKIETRTARAKLPVASKPYWRSLDEGLAVGYRKGSRSGKWVLRFYAGDGKYTTETLGVADDYADADGLTVLDFRQAQVKARERVTALTAAAKGVRLGPYTVDAALDDYFANKPKTNDNGRADYYIRPYLGDREIAKLTADKIRQWLRDTADRPPLVRGGKPRQVREPESEEERLEQQRARQDSANRVFTVLRAALNHAFYEGRVNADGAWRRVKKFETTTKARVRYLTAQEVTRLLNAAQGDFRELVRGAIYTGARYGDLCAMDVGDFNPDRGFVMSGNSKAGKPHPVYLADEGIAFFKRITAGRKNTEPMFTTDGRRWRKSDQSRPMKAAVEAAKIDPPISFHGLRHTYCSLAVMAGVPLNVVAANVGHADTRMVETHYGHLAPSYVADQIRAGLPSFGGEGGGKVASLTQNAKVSA
jgi:integrase